MISLRAGIIWVGLLLIAWVLGFVWFVITTPTQSESPRTPTDAIVVLTGGKGRVEHGFRLLAEGAAPLLFISGVGKDVTLEEMITAHTRASTRQKIYANNSTIILGHQASSTETNAEEVAEFIRLRPLTSMRLVTSHYHMKRSILEFTRAMPDITVYAEPVLPQEQTTENALLRGASLRLMLSEYHKFLAVLVRPIVT